MGRCHRLHSALARRIHRRFVDGVAIEGGWRRLGQVAQEFSFVQRRTGGRVRHGEDATEPGSKDPLAVDKCVQDPDREPQHHFDGRVPHETGWMGRDVLYGTEVLPVGGFAVRSERSRLAQPHGLNGGLFVLEDVRQVALYWCRQVVPIARSRDRMCRGARGRKQVVRDRLVFTVESTPFYVDRPETGEGESKEGQWKEGPHGLVFSRLESGLGLFAYGASVRSPDPLGDGIGRRGLLCGYERGGGRVFVYARRADTSTSTSH